MYCEYFFLANSMPVTVVVEITHSHSGRSFSIRFNSGASRLTSPTLTACSHTHFLSETRRGTSPKNFAA